MKALFCSCTHTKTCFEKNISRGVFHRVFWGCRGGVEGVCVTKKETNDHSQEKNCKSLKSPIWRLYIVPIPKPKHIWWKSLQRSIPQSIFGGVGGVEEVCVTKTAKYDHLQEKIKNHSKVQYEGSILFPYPHQDIFWGKNLQRSIPQSIYGLEWYVWPKIGYGEDHVRAKFLYRTILTWISTCPLSNGTVFISLL